MPANYNFSRKPKNARGTLRRLLGTLGAYKFVLFAVMAMSVAGNLLSLLGPSLAGKAINAAAAGKGQVDFSLVMTYAGQMLAVYLVSSLLTVAISVLMMNVSKKIAQRMRGEIFAKLEKLPVSFFDRNAAGDLISRVSYDVDVVSTCLATDVVSILTNITSIIGSFVMMLIISPVMSVIVIFSVPVSILYTSHIRKVSRPLYSIRSKNYGKMNGFVEEMFDGQKTIQAYAREQLIGSRFEKVNGEAAKGYRDADSVGVTMGPSMGMINNVSLGLIATLGCLLYMRGAATLGQISSFVLYSRKFSGPVNEIANVVNEIFSALSAAERVYDLLDQPEELPDAEDAKVLTDVKGDVRAEHVAFGYDPARIILHDFCLHAEPGRLIAIVGPTGAGKTTIINLLMRFYDVNGGRILVDGADIRGVTRKSLRGAYAMVLQDTWVFNGTIFDNIAYGREGATREEVIAAAKAAHIHSFIMRLPDGYDTVINEDGDNISKGQKQLLTLARAMLYDCRMLILDEATSNVDTGTERQVQSAMRSLMAGKTCFVIAHRLSTIRSADCILVVDHGDVVETGTHEELMAKDGAYAKLYKAQFE